MDGEPYLKTLDLVHSVLFDIVFYMARWGMYVELMLCNMRTSFLQTNI